jgi:hypothetical protein
MTDEWKGYRPIMNDFKIEQIPSNNGVNFKALHMKALLKFNY